MLGELSGLSSALRAGLIGAGAILILALGLSLWGNLRQSERIGEIEVERDGLEAGLTAAGEAYAEAVSWSQKKDAAAAAAVVGLRVQLDKARYIKEGYIAHARNDDQCFALDAALDGLRAEYPDDHGGSSGAAAAAPGADRADTGPAGSDGGQQLKD